MKKFFLLFTLLIGFISFSQTSFIQVVSEPDVTVFLDDIFIGKTTPEFGGLIIEDVSSGSHTLKFVKEGFNSQEERVNIISGEVFSFQVRKFIPKIKISQKGNEDENSIELIIGDLKIQSLPISISISIPELGINSKKVEDEWLGEDIPVGEYYSTFTWNGKKLNKKILIESNKTTHILVNFPKMEIEDRIEIEHIEEVKIHEEKPKIKRKSFLERNNYHGKVKQIDGLYYRILEAFHSQTKITPSTLIDEIYRIGPSIKSSKKYKKYLGFGTSDSSFDKDGNLIDDSIEEKYDDNGNIIERKKYWSDGNIWRRSLMKYDDSGNIIERKVYFKDGRLNEKYLFKYDDYNNRIETIKSDTDGIISEISFTKYDDKNNKIVTIKNDSIGNLSERTLYKYDDNNNLIESYIYDPKDSLIQFFKYKFDGSNNWIEILDYKYGKLNNVYIREIEYY